MNNTSTVGGALHVSTHNDPHDEAARLAQERLAWLRFMRQVLDPLPAEELVERPEDPQEPVDP